MPAETPQGSTRTRQTPVRSRLRAWPTPLGAKGALFFVCVLLLFFATPYSNLFFLLNAFLGALGGLGLLGAWNNLRRAQAAIVRIEPAPVGGAAHVSLRVSLRRPCFGATLLVEVGGRLVEAAQCAALRDGDLVEGTLRGLPRGVHAVTGVRIRSRHPFGVVMFESRCAAGHEAVSYPQPDESQPIRPAAGLDGPYPASGAEESISWLRQWRHGDAIRQIHWKATARRGEPIVKETERHGGCGAEIVLDRRLDEAALEAALAAAAGHVLHAARSKEPLRLRSQDADLRFDPDRGTADAMLRWLADARPLPVDAAPPPPPNSLRPLAEAARA